jgi:hypothetical protein
MQNLYDLLGVRPDDGAENLRKAFRKAAKESHPDHHGGDPESVLRFRQITEAYDILRDAGQRAAYDQWLESERRPLRWKLKRVIGDMKRHVVGDVAAGALLAIVLAGGYELYAGLSHTPAGGAGEIAAVQRAVQGGATRAQMPMPTLIYATPPVASIPAAQIPAAQIPAAQIHAVPIPTAVSGAVATPAVETTGGPPSGD